MKTVNDLLTLNVNEHTEKKANLTYLSWAWAWAEALKHDPLAFYQVQMWGKPGEGDRRGEDQRTQNTDHEAVQHFPGCSPPEQTHHDDWKRHDGCRAVGNAKPLSQCPPASYSGIEW